MMLMKIYIRIQKGKLKCCQPKKIKMPPAVIFCSLTKLFKIPVVTKELPSLEATTDQLQNIKDAK